MPLKLFGISTHPNAFAATKAAVSLEQCEFFLDFSRPIKRMRWLGVHNKWVGFTAGLLVPVIHQGEETGGYVFGLRAGEPYFQEIQDLWRIHRGTPRSMKSKAVEPMEIIAAFANHFSEDC